MVLFPPDCDLISHTFNRYHHVARSEDFIHTVEKISNNEDEQLRYIRRSQFPELAACWTRKIIFELVSEDFLLIPPRWWHYSEILETSTAIDWWFIFTDFSCEKRV